MESLFRVLEVSGSGLTAERLRMDVIANNIANANTVNAQDGTPYRRKSVILNTMHDNRFNFSFRDSLRERGVQVSGIAEDRRPPQLKYDPSHPNADEEGMVMLSNVNVLNEMVDMISATRAFEANVTAIEATKSMAKRAISIGNL